MIGKFKGRKGYISLLKKYDLAFVAASALVCFLVYYLGLKIWHSKANIGTVVAVCSLLPACQRLTNLILIMPFKGIGDKEYEKILPAVKPGWITVSDMLFSTEKSLLEFDHVVMTNSRMLILSKMSRDKNSYSKEYFETSLRKRGISMKVNIYTELNDYVAVLNRSEEEKFENEKAWEYVSSLLV